METDGGAEGAPEVAALLATLGTGGRQDTGSEDTGGTGAPGDPDAREAALHTLLSATWRDDDFAVATAHAVPELARLAREVPAHRADLLRLLGDLADRPDWPDARRPARDAVAAELPGLLPSAHDPDAAVRDAVLPLVVACGRTDAVPLLRARLAAEPEPAVRGHLVTALALLDPGDGAWRHPLLADPAPEVRLAAAEDLLRTTGPPFPDDLVDVCARAYGEIPYELDEAPQWPGRHERLGDRLLADPGAALRAAAAGVPLAFEVTEHWRDREADALPWALRELEAEDPPWQLLRLARLCRALPPGLHAPVRDRVRPLLARDVPVRTEAVTVLAVAGAPESVEEAVRLVEGAPGPPPGAYRVARAAATVTEAFGAAALPVARAVARRIGHGHPDLLRVLERYPDVAVAAVDDVVPLVSRYEGGHAWTAVALLGALGPAAGDRAARALLAEATGGGHSTVALYAAMAHHRVTGDPGPALDRLRAEGPGAWLDFVGDLGPAGTPLLPWAEERLAPGTPTEVRAVAARAVWRVTGRTEDTVEPLARRAAAGEGHHRSRLDAVRELTRMGLLPRWATAPLREVADADRRVVSGLGPDDGPHPDDVLRDAVRTLLATAEPVG
ncbi:hypothetical protein [Streptomyces longwoodensis]|uniref:hypothetical protein n=1 Tax=Streptomyces longwoodensis TaxID=68231 RepID=UPI0033C5191E